MIVQLTNQGQEHYRLTAPSRVYLFEKGDYNQTIYFFGSWHKVGRYLKKLSLLIIYYTILRHFEFINTVYGFKKVKHTSSVSHYWIISSLLRRNAQAYEAIFAIGKKLKLTQQSIVISENAFVLQSLTFFTEIHLH